MRPQMTRPSITDEDVQRLIAAAREAVSRAYAPYSNFHVGAAILTDADEVFTGCNVENASYGLTNCAERTAIFAAVLKRGGANVPRGGFIRAIAVANHLDGDCSPCGACRQVIYEFGPDALVIYKNKDGLQQRHITELLPDGFRL